MPGPLKSPAFLMRCRKECAAFFFPLLLWFCVDQCRAQIPFVSAEAFLPSSSTTGSFIENKGQWPSNVRYLARLDGMDAWVTDRGIVYDFYRNVSEGGSDSAQLFSLAQPIPNPAQHPDLQEFSRRQGQVVRMEFAGAAGHAASFPATKEKGYHNYLIGADRSKWATQVPLYGSVVLRELYPGVDGVLRFDGGGLRYDLHVAAGGDPGRIRMKISGAGEIAVNGKGELVMRTGLGEITHGAIWAYQEIDGKQQEVECSFRQVNGNEVAFSLGIYDRRYPLVIDPLVYATYLSGTDYGSGGSLVVDDQGSAYVVGRASAGTYPTTTGAYDETFGGRSNTDIVVTKLNEAGTEAIYSTYIGGAAADAGTAIEIDEGGNAYIIGWTQVRSDGNDFPVTPGAFRTTPSAGSQNSTDIVVCKLNEDGTQLLYATYLGGNSNEWPGGIAVDKLGNAYIAGHSGSRDYPVTPTALKTEARDVGFYSLEGVVSKLNATGSALLYSTYLGGESYDWVADIAVDAEGYAYVTGETSSWEFPTTRGAYDERFDEGSSNFYYDAFVSKLDINGSKLIYSTFLGQKQNDQGRGIAVDNAGHAYVTGVTASTSFPITPDAFDSRLSGLSDGFVVKFDSTGTRLLYATFIGGDGSESFYKIALYEDGRAAVVGVSSSDNYPITPGAYDSKYSDNNNQNDVVVSVFNTSGQALIYSTYLGDKGQDVAVDIAVGPSEDVYVGGYTTAPAFPVTPGAYDTLAPSSQSDRAKMFVARFRLSCGITARIGADLSVCSGASVPLNTEVTNGVPSYTYSWSPAQGLNKIDVADPVASPTATTQYVVTVTDGSGCIARDTIVISVLNAPVAIAGSDTTICSGGSALLGGEASGARPPFTYAWEPKVGLSDPTIARPIARPDANQRYIVTVTDTKGCQAKDTVDVTVLDPLQVNVGENVEICTGQGVVIGGEATGGQGPYQYMWEPADGLSRPDVAQPTASPTVTTSYRVRITDNYGCTFLSELITVTVRSKPAPVLVPSGPTTFCEGGSVVLDAGGDYDSYLWSNGETTRSITVTKSGRYSVEVDGGTGCAGVSDTVDVAVLSLPDVRITGPVGVCIDGTNLYSVPEGPDLTYEWNLLSLYGTISSGRQSNRMTVRWGSAENAVIRLVVRNAVTDCADTALYQVSVGTGLKPLVRGSNAVMPLCAGESVVLDAGEGYADYRWSTGEVTRMIVVNQTADVTVTVRDAEGCEGSSDPYSVTVRPPLDITLTPGGDLRLCPGAKQTLMATPGFTSYNWSTGETGQLIDVSAEGIYWVEVSSAEGCRGWSDTVRVSYSEDSPVITPSGALSFCEGESVTLSAAAGYAFYEWSTGETGRSIVVKRQGNYWVKVTGIGGCQSQSAVTAVTVFPLPSVSAIRRVGDTLITDAAAGYQWIRDGVDIPSATAQRYVIDRQGVYKVRVFNQQGCSAESDELAGNRMRTVWLDTVGGEVGERIWLTMYVDPPLSLSEGVTDYSATLHWNPEALFPHSATPGGIVTGNNLNTNYSLDGTILVKPVSGGSVLEGNILFRLEVEGLITGDPTNIVEIENLMLEGLGSLPARANGLVTLTGCEVGRDFSKRARILSIVPNPGFEQVQIVYRTPAGMRMNLRVLDLLGRVLETRELEPGSGEEELVRVELSGLSAGLYLLELRDREEVVTAPLLIKR